MKVNAIKENSFLSFGNLDVAKALNSTASLARMSEATSGACVWFDPAGRFPHAGNSLSAFERGAPAWF